MSVEEMDKLESGKIVNQVEIKGTPFIMMELDDGKRKCKFVAWGKNRISKFLTDEEAAETRERLIEGKMDWDIAGAMAACIAINITEENK